VLFFNPVVMLAFASISCCATGVVTGYEQSSFTLDRENYIEKATFSIFCTRCDNFILGWQQRVAWVLNISFPSLL
jgi:hypothetical protein